MQYIKGIDAFREEKRTAVTLGKFDGLHRGHQKLIEKIRSYAGNDCVSVVCAFDMQRSCLMTKEERKKLLAGKVDYLIDYPFTGDLMTMEAERFIQKILYEKLHAAHIVVGSDFSFGYRKRGDHQMLERYAQKYDYTVDVVEKSTFGRPRDQQHLCTGGFVPWKYPAGTGTSWISL